MKLTAVLNKVSVSKVLSTFVKHKVFSVQGVFKTSYMHKEYGNFIGGKKKPISAYLVICLSSLHLLDLGWDAVVCCTIACF